MFVGFDGNGWRIYAFYGDKNITVSRNDYYKFHMHVSKHLIYP
jgi:hypothetical protein